MRIYELLSPGGSRSAFVRIVEFLQFSQTRSTVLTWRRLTPIGRSRSRPVSVDLVQEAEYLVTSTPERLWKERRQSPPDPVGQTASDVAADRAVFEMA